jgi:hypothetical protein
MRIVMFDELDKLLCDAHRKNMKNQIDRTSCQLVAVNSRFV